MMTLAKQNCRSIFPIQLIVLCLFKIITVTAYYQSNYQVIFKNDTKLLTFKAKLLSDAHTHDHHHVHDVDDENGIHSLYPIMKRNSSYIDIISSCDAFIDLFSEAFANYSKCVVLSARPLHFCGNCVEQYVHAKSIYEHIMTGDMKDAHGLSCGEMILNADRIQIIVRAAKFVDKIWTDCDCSNCFESYSDVNDTIIVKLSNKTEQFQILYNKTIRCFQNYSEGALIPSTHYVNITNSSVCSNCDDEYDALNELYESIEKDAPFHVCMDTVDAMNFTRMLWSRDFQCRRPHSHNVPVLLIAVFFVLLPVLFYGGTRLTNDKVQRQLLSQKRMKNVTNNELTESQCYTDDGH